MKDAIHPAYQPVLFHDTASGEIFLTRSALAGSRLVGAERRTWTDGREYPVVRVEISNTSHPFWTGDQRIVDTAGQVEKFRRRYGGRPGRSA